MSKVAGNLNVDDVRAALRAYLDRTGRSQADVAATVGISPAAMSQWMRSVYQGDNESVAAKVTGYLEVEAKRARAPMDAAFVETSIATEVLRVCEFAHVHRVIGVVNGEAGMGKTMALHEYCKRHPGTLYVRCNPSFGKPIALLEALLNALGRATQRAPALNRLLDEAVDALGGTQRLVILDEAQFLTRESLETARTLHDEAGIPVVMSGNYDLYNRMTGKSASLWAQVFSRVGIQREVRRTGTLEDVQRLVGEMDPECMRYLHARTREPGGFRRMRMVWHMATQIAERDGGTLTVKHLELAASLLMSSSRAA